MTAPRYITGLDIETTGLEMTSGDRIIEVCLQVFDPATGRLALDFTKRINPEGQKIAPKAQKVHGIHAADLVGKPKFRELAPQINAILGRTALLVTHNGNAFDLPFLAIEMQAAGLALPGHLAAVDTMADGMWASYDAKPPSLAEFCWAMGVDYDPAKAHAAQYDVQVMMAAFFTAARRGLFDTRGLVQPAAAA